LNLIDRPQSSEVGQRFAFGAFREASGIDDIAGFVQSSDRLVVVGVGTSCWFEFIDNAFA
jgi:hypothetical protein